ncbi:hypothetical protein ACFFJ7_11465 [Pseudochelatococcus lubricantis]|uniref:hypothetical protein n=1 Tax=Pseudochelatococcus lubricantis TaxID=1538102 RepID=UPI0035EFDF19
MSELVRLDDLDALMQRVRADVEARKARADARIVGGNGAEVAPPPLDPAQLRYTATEILAHYDVVFMRAAYLSLLGREPAGEDAARFLQQLRLGQISRIDLIDALAATDEAQARGARISGLRRERFLDRIRRSRLGRKIVALASLARSIPRLASEVRRLAARVDTAERKAQQLERRLEEEHKAKTESEVQFSRQIEVLTQKISELERHLGGDVPSR